MTTRRAVLYLSLAALLATPLFLLDPRVLALEWLLLGAVAHIGGVACLLAVAFGFWVGRRIEKEQA